MKLKSQFFTTACIVGVLLLLFLSELLTGASSASVSRRDSSPSGPRKRHDGRLPSSQLNKRKISPAVAGGSGDNSASVEDESEEDEEDENESQARVEPQITPLNRDECLAKLLCGMSVPVSGGGSAPKNSGYYSQYANVVAKFFNAFPLEDEEEQKQSVESIESYDDYSFEDDDNAIVPSSTTTKSTSTSTTTTTSKPRVNSKLKVKTPEYHDYAKKPASPEPTSPTTTTTTTKASTTATTSSTGLQLIDLAVITRATDPTTSSATEGSNARSMEDEEDDERNARRRSKWNMASRMARARKIMTKKVGDKLQTVRQCQQISGCPFTFKQLRAKLKAASQDQQDATNPKESQQHENNNQKEVSIPKSRPSRPSVVAPTKQKVKEPLLFDDIKPIEYVYNTNSYRPNKNKPKPIRHKYSSGSTELLLGKPITLSTSDNIEPYKDTQKGDDELEEFFGPPPVFGSNGRPVNHKKTQFVQQNPRPILTEEQQAQRIPDEYIPYVPSSSQKAQIQSGNPFPKKKIAYHKGPSTFYLKRKPDGDNDEFDDVNLSTGPISLVEGHDGTPVSVEKKPDFIVIDGKNKGSKDNEDEDGAKGDENDNDDEDEEEDEDDGAEGEDNDNNESEEEEEEDEDEEDETDDEKKKSKKTNDKVEITTSAPSSSAESKKTIKYKNPSPDSLIVVEEEFPTIKKSVEDDEHDNPETDEWNRLKWATSSALIKEPKDKVRTKLEKKNDEKFGLSKETSDEEEEEEQDEENDEDASEEEDGKKSTKTKSRKETTSKKDEKKKTKNNEDDEADEAKVSSKKKKKSKGRTKSKTTKGEDQEEIEEDIREEKGRDKKKPEVEEEVEGDISEEDGKKKRPVGPPPLLEIGGRPIAPPPDKGTKKQKKTGGLSRFKFNFVRPFGAQTTGEEMTAVYNQHSALPNYTPQITPSHSHSSSGSNSFRNEMLGGEKTKKKTTLTSYTSSSHQYLNPTVNSAPSSFQTNNADKSPSMITFPFSPLSTLKTLFNKKPSSSSMHEHHQPNSAAPAPVSSFMYRPAGPASNVYQRPSEGSSGMMSDRSRSDIKLKQEKPKRRRSGLEVPKKNKNKHYHLKPKPKPKKQLKSKPKPQSATFFRRRQGTVRPKPKKQTTTALKRNTRRTG